MTCNRCGHTELILSDEHEINRIRGNNYDIVTWEQLWSCRKCEHEQVTQEMLRDAITPDYMEYDQSSSNLELSLAPTRFGT